MSELKATIRADMTAALKARDSMRVSTLRMVLTAITNAEVAGSAAQELTDDQVIDVLASEAKKRKEAAEAYDGAGRDESAASERAEAEIIAEYLPAWLSEEEVAAIVDEAIAATGASSMRDMGSVMKLVQPRTTGKADGSKVAAMVKSRLG